MHTKDSGSEKASMENAAFKVCSESVQYLEDCILSQYDYDSTTVENVDGQICVYPQRTRVQVKTETKVPKLGVMLVGWGGNNGSTVTAAILANKHQMAYKTKFGEVKPNYFGSVTQSSTVSLGRDNFGNEIFVPLGKLLPMVNPNDLELDGWDISNRNLAEAVANSQVIDYDLQRQLGVIMSEMKPRPSFYQPDFIAANQKERANNLKSAVNKSDVVEQIRSDIRDFKAKKNLDKVIVLWTANTERFCEIAAGVHDTADNLLAAIQRNEHEISPSTLFAVASILEGSTYINGSPQNTFVPGVVELAEKLGVFLAGDDFKSGQTKLKSVLVDFLISAGLKPTSIVSYNHLGNNDGMNLSAPQQFTSKEISKSNVVDDMVQSNDILYAPGEKPDHCVVIKYVPYVGDSKRAMDEYISELMFGGRSTIAIHNTCEDSLLASPLILDLVILAEICQRITFKQEDSTEWEPFHPVLTILSYLSKAPLVPSGTPVVNALFKQRQCIENIFRACVGLAPVNNMLLEYKLSSQISALQKTHAASVADCGDVIAKDHPLEKAVSNGVTANGHAVANGHTIGNGHTVAQNGSS